VVLMTHPRISDEKRATAALGPNFSGERAPRRAPDTAHSS
jgi:hypothetical protein